MFEILSITLLLIYAVFILGNCCVLLIQRKEIGLKNYSPKTKITIIIPARNEEQTILKCLQSISIQQFPENLLQVIVVDDGSIDNTVTLAETFLKENFVDYKLIRMESKEPGGKKSAILKAIEQAEGSIIITRDADSYTENPLWLKSLVYSFEKENCDLLISPVILHGDNSFLSNFQKFENLAINALGLSMTKIKLPFVCSGANLAYKKEKFLQCQPYQNNLNLGSGDDMFLLKSFFLNRYSINSNTSTESIIYTGTETSFKKMLLQRLRWASKSGKINTLPVFFTGLLMLSVNALCLLALCLPFVNSLYLTISLLTLTIKFIIDFLLLILSARMFKQKVSWLLLPLAFLFNGIYVPVLTFASIFVKPNWKGRRQ